MTRSFVVLEPDAVLGENAAEGAVFVRDGFSLPAFILPFVWLLVQRLWVEAALVLIATFALGFIGGIAGLGSATPLLALLVSTLVGFEGANWRIARLRRNGFVEKAIIEAHDESDAEIRYFSERFVGNDDNTHPVIRMAPAMVATTSARQTFSSGIGLVGHRGDN